MKMNEMENPEKKSGKGLVFCVVAATALSLLSLAGCSGGTGAER
jgi:hypothetical protein